MQFSHNNNHSLHHLTSNEETVVTDKLWKCTDINTSISHIHVTSMAILAREISDCKI